MTAESACRNSYLERAQQLFSVRLDGSRASAAPLYSIYRCIKVGYKCQYVAVERGVVARTGVPN